MKFTENKIKNIIYTVKISTIFLSTFGIIALSGQLAFGDSVNGVAVQRVTQPDGTLSENYAISDKGIIYSRDGLILYGEDGTSGMLVPEKPVIETPPIPKDPLPVVTKIPTPIEQKTPQPVLKDGGHLDAPSHIEKAPTPIEQKTPQPKLKDGGHLDAPSHIEKAPTPIEQKTPQPKLKDGGHLDASSHIEKAPTPIEQKTPQPKLKDGGHLDAPSHIEKAPTPIEQKTPQPKLKDGGHLDAPKNIEKDLTPIKKEVPQLTGTTEPVSIANPVGTDIHAKIEKLQYKGVSLPTTGSNQILERLFTTLGILSIIGAVLLTTIKFSLKRD